MEPSALSRARTAACAASAAVFLLLVLGSVVRTVEPSAIEWQGERVRWEHAPPLAQGLVAAQHAVPFNPLLFPAWRSALRPGDRYAIVLGTPRGPRTAGGAIEMYARYYLLPNVEVARPNDADVVLSIARDPRTLGLRLQSFREFGRGVYAARVKRG